jgi:hypothetical protein
VEYTKEATLGNWYNEELQKRAKGKVLHDVGVEEHQEKMARVEKINGVLAEGRWKGIRYVSDAELGKEVGVSAGTVRRYRREGLLIKEVEHVLSKADVLAADMGCGEGAVVAVDVEA